MTMGQRIPLYRPNLIGQFCVTTTHAWKDASALPAVCFAAGASSSLLDSSPLELSAAVFAFLADGPFVASAPLEGAFRFLDSGDLNKSNVFIYNS